MADATAAPSAQPVPGFWPRHAGPYFAALPAATTSVLYLVTWFAPQAIDTQMVKHLVMVVLIEFIIMHSSAFTGAVIYGDMPKKKKVGGLLGLTGLYSLFILGFSLGFKSWWPAAAFLVLTTNRVASIFSTRSHTDIRKGFHMSSWAVSGVSYIFGTMACVMLPLPRFGITDAVIAAQGFTSGGLFVEEPHRPLFFGFVYFALQALWQVTGPGSVARRLAKKMAEEPVIQARVDAKYERWKRDAQRRKEG